MPGLGGNWKSTYIIKIFRLSTTFGNIYKFYVLIGSGFLLLIGSGFLLDVSESIWY
jgi:hypothetical protein